MAGWVAETGSTLLIPSGPSGAHLFVIVFGPQVLQDYGPSAQFVSVSVTTLRADIHHDPSCMLKPGDHPFIKHDSYVSYRDARIDTGDDLKRRVEDGVFQPHQPLDSQILARIVFGVCQSKFVRREIKKIMGCF